MANIASGYLSIGIKGEQATTELRNSIEESGLFIYGGDVDIESGDEELNVGFSCAWNGDDCWNWIDEQLSEGSSLSDTCKEALRNAQIDGYTYEYGCQHRDRVYKPAGESTLKREQASIPDDIVNALKIANAFSLNPEESRIVSGGTVTLLSKCKSGDNENDSVYSFSIACGYSMELTLSVNESTLLSEETEYSIVEIELEDWDPEDGDENYDETSMFKEIVDDIVADFDEIYSKPPFKPAGTARNLTVTTDQADEESINVAGRRDLVGLFYALRSDAKLKADILETNGDLDQCLEVVTASGFDVTKGDWFKLQALRLGTRSADDRIAKWNEMILPLTSTELEYLSRY